MMGSVCSHRDISDSLLGGAEKSCGEDVWGGSCWLQGPPIPPAWVQTGKLPSLSFGTWLGVRDRARQQVWQVTEASHSPKTSCCDLGNPAKFKLSFLEHLQATLAFTVPFSSFPSSISSNAASYLLPEINRANITWLTKGIWAGRGGGKINM